MTDLWLYLMVVLMGLYFITGVVIEMMYGNDISNWVSVIFLSIAFAIFAALNLPLWQIVYINGYSLGITAAFLFVTWFAAVMSVREWLRYIDDMKMEYPQV